MYDKGWFVKGWSVKGVVYLCDVYLFDYVEVYVFVVEGIFFVVFDDGWVGVNVVC